MRRLLCNPRPSRVYFLGLVLAAATCGAPDGTGQDGAGQPRVEDGTGGGSGGTQQDGGTGGGGSRDAADRPRDLAVDRPPADGARADKPLDPGQCHTTDDCPATHYCSHLGTNTCGYKEEACLRGYNVYCGDPGDCIQRFDSCTNVDHPVCGCDLRTYKNPCIAAMMGVDTADFDAPCK